MFDHKFQQEVLVRYQRSVWSPEKETHMLLCTASDLESVKFREIISLWCNALHPDSRKKLKRRLLSAGSFFETIDEIKTGTVLTNEGINVQFDPEYSWVLTS